jgi:pimeloyl-ACP methyl ester carboxylesterase
MSWESSQFECIRCGVSEQAMTFPSVLLLALAVMAMPVCASAQQATMPITRTIEVDGLSMRVRTAGLEQRTSRQAVVVFESGGSAPLETWDSILPAVSRLAPVVAYDRAGTGESAWDSLPPTPERVAARLERLLSQLEVPPPYILVGHSWGGALARYFAGSHPEEIAAVLYVDPTDITLTDADLIAVFESFGAGAAEYEAFQSMMEQAMSRASAPLRAESAVIMGLLKRDPQSQPLPEPPDVPTSVIVAGRVNIPPQNLVPFDATAYANAMHESQVRRLRTWVKNGGTFQVAANAGHIVHVDDPPLIIDAIRNLIDRTR